MLKLEDFKEGISVDGPVFGQPAQIIKTTLAGKTATVFYRGLRDEQFHERTLTEEQAKLCKHLDGDGSFGGNPKKFRLGIEAMRLGLAYEYDPYFALSIARVDPLPHQLEAVYEHFLKLPRIRFLLADDPGAGKTIMAGLLIKELKSRGLVQRILIMGHVFFGMTIQDYKVLKRFSSICSTNEQMRGLGGCCNLGSSSQKTRGPSIPSTDKQ